MPKLHEIIRPLESLAPPILQESYDNSGLLVGHPNMDITGVVVALDALESVVQEAIDHGCNLVIAHHPIVFGGLKRFNGKNYIERTVMKAIKHDIAIYAIHTNLDNVRDGVNRMIADKLGLINCRVLSPKIGLLRKLVTFAPATHAEAVREALFKAGAGAIGLYDSCSFNLSGTGTFRGQEGSDPFIGKPGELRREAEERIEVIFESWKEGALLKALRGSHPYQTVAYDLYSLENSHQDIGSGLVGELPVPMEEMDFLRFLKDAMGAACVRHTAPTGRKVSRVSVCGGAGSFLLKEAKATDSQVFVTADYKYHQFFDAEGELIIADIGHYESEQFTGILIRDLLLRNFPTFAVRLTQLTTNPVHYLC